MHHSLPLPFSRFHDQGQRNSSERNYAGQNSSYRSQNHHQNERAHESPPQFKQEYSSDTRYQKESQHPQYNSENNYRKLPQFASQNNDIEQINLVDQDNFRGRRDSQFCEEPRKIQNAINQHCSRTESNYPVQIGNLDYKDREMPQYSRQNNEIYRNMKQSRHTHYDHNAYRFNEDTQYPEANNHRYSAYQGEPRVSSQSSTGNHQSSYEPRYSNQDYPVYKRQNIKPWVTGQNYSNRSQYREDLQFPIHRDRPCYSYKDEPHYPQQNNFAYKDKSKWQAQNNSPDRQRKDDKYPYQPAYLNNQRGFKQQHPVQHNSAPSRYNGHRQSGHNNYRRDFSTAQSWYSDKVNSNSPYSSNHQVNQSDGPYYRPYDYRAPLQTISHRPSEQEKYKNSFVLNANATEFIPSTSLIIDKSKKPILVVFDLNGVLILRKKKTQILRPFATELIDFMAKHFYIAVWSSARKVNVDSMVSKAFRENQSQLLECWDRSKCELNGRFSDKCDSFKDLSKLWASLDRRYSSLIGYKFGEHNTVIIDDSPTKIKYQPSNQIRIAEYAKVDPEDIELQQLKSYFEALLENLNSDSFDIRDYLLESKFKSTKELIYS
ncbi:hypothetical protein DSO57_1016968 [Entomophthora muscae]|nr:hypothetical protein DSO57_1016968 [Entomophthora muscae]